ncbi:sulfurtransferase [Sinorhizobium medicae]|uniref:Rhodanese domain protein n=1 Tax=Sinorhizobium medicae (strain WSM419) TaxID=366394 RepID=A6ULR4_SINMW|nr:sulfurtransferase [Sinorhizobium medicae]ABR64594.1 Rhodanese domain protein [Sinorhizobium medicae WSM419]MBO1944913.1 sulfurtransferase [Sinorhizobium medicae]MDX0413735.1 sulfurtransferase [Sinorhizobium medicae]MDX0426119.1 sulfurtransferase [Sinorhizobium medicae]MDX0431651.1 sulfurtransferase [Sinorhizobium medicae]
MRLASLAFTLTVLASSALAAEVKPLVDAEWVKAKAGDENVVILDIRDKVAETELGDKPYIEGAVVAPYASAGWRTEVDGVPGMLPPLEQITKLIGDLGIDNDDHVVIIPWGTDSSEFGGATRIYWTFKYLGHDEVSILDGGWRQYDAAGGARSAEPAKPEPATFAAEPQEELLATTEEVAAALEAGKKLIDGRPAEQYEGKSKSPIVRANGTIPGSANIEHSKLYSKDHALFARPETVKALTEAVGLAADEENITFCNTGHWASVTWFALSEVLGNKKTSMYDGSMAEWTADPARAVENKSGT